MKNLMVDVFYWDGVFDLGEEVNGFRFSKVLV